MSFPLARLNAERALELAPESAEAHVALALPMLYYEWDWVGLSHHFLKTDGMYANLVSRRQANFDALGKIGIEKVVTTYLQNLLQALHVIPADMLCHLDAVLRHHPQILFSSHHYELIGKLLQGMARKNMALEVNTSGFPIRGEPFPSLSVLKQAVDIGLPLAPASDAHRPADVGRHFSALAELLNS